MSYNPFRNILLVMSLSGSVIVLSYILIYPIAKRYFSFACKYWILKIALAFYLIPFPQYSSRIRSIIFDMFPHLEDRFGAPLGYLDMEYAVVTEGNSVYASIEVKKMLALTVGLGILSCVVILFYVFRYRKARKVCIRYSDMYVEKEMQELFQEIKNRLAIRRKVELLCSEYCKSPFTMGIAFPIVIIPLWKEEPGVETCQNVIEHELVHIKHHDMLFKFLGIIVIALHWFNPFAYFLYYEISNISEMYCDSIVLEGKGEKERKAYGEMLLRLATESASVDKKFSAGITGSSKRIFKRRIIEMKTDRKNKTMVSALALILICITGGMTIFAYDTPQTLSVLDDMGGTSLEQEFCFYAEGELEIEAVELPYDYFFTDELGNIYNLDGGDNEARAACSHTYVSGGTTRHNKNSSGGCTITYFEALRCSKCGDVKTGEEIQTITYKKCPH